MERMKVIAVDSLEFKKGLLDNVEKVKIQMVWRETNSKFHDHLPHKTIEDLQSEMALLEFCRKAARRINNEIPKAIEKLHDLYEKIHQGHEKCHIPLVQKITELPEKDQRIAQLQDGLWEDLEYIRKMDAFIEEDIHHFVGQDSINAYFLEDICKATTEWVVHIETHLSIHEVTLQVLEPIKCKAIDEEANAWEIYISSMVWPT